MVKPVSVTAVLNLVECGSERVKKPRITVSKNAEKKGSSQSKNSRANDSQDERAPRQVARIIASIRRLTGDIT